MKKNIKTCKFCHQLKHLPGGATYCTTCYRKFVRGKKECKRCHHLRVVVARGYCGTCYNYVMGYYGLATPGLNSRLKWSIKPQKCFFCNEDRIHMLDIHKIDEKDNIRIENLVLLCPNHHREVHLGFKSLSVNN